MNVPRRLRWKTSPDAIVLVESTSRNNLMPCLEGTGFRGHYDVLGIKRTASASEVKAAFKRRALLTHPDKNKAADAAMQFNLVFQAHETLAFEDRRIAYDAELKLSQNRDGLHDTDVGRTTETSHSNLSSDIGEARILWEMALLQDGMSLDDKPLEVLLAMQKLITEPKVAFGDGTSELVHNVDLKGINRRSDGAYTVFVQWKGIRVECNGIRSLESAVDFHAELSALKNRSLLPENSGRGLLLEEEFFNTLRAEPRLQPVVQLRVGANVTLQSRDIRWAIQFARKFPSNDQKSIDKWVAKAKSAAGTCRLQRLSRTAALPKMMAAALAVRSRELHSRVRELKEVNERESESTSGHKRLLAALKLTPEAVMVLCRRLETLPEPELKRRREALFARSDPGVVRVVQDVARCQNGPALCNVEQPTVKSPSDVPQVKQQAPLKISSAPSQVSSLSWLVRNSRNGMLVVGFLSLVDAAPVRAVSKLGLGTMKTATSELLRDFKYKPGDALIGLLPERRTMRGRIIRQATPKLLGGHRHYLMPFLLAHADIFRSLDLSLADAHAKDCISQPQFRSIIKCMGQLRKAVFPSRAFEWKRDLRLLSDCCPPTCTVVFI